MSYKFLICFNKRPTKQPLWPPKFMLGKGNRKIFKMKTRGQKGVRVKGNFVVYVPLALAPQILKTS